MDWETAGIERQAQALAATSKTVGQLRTSAAGMASPVARVMMEKTRRTIGGTDARPPESMAMRVGELAAPLSQIS